jgi:hypothetical protein
LENETPDNSEEAQIAQALAETPGSTPSEADAPAVEAPTWNGEEWAFETGGKRVVPESRDAVLKWANQGFNYSQRMGELNKTHSQRMAEAEQRTQKAAELEQKYSPYAKVDQYAEQNKDWWAHVQNQFALAQQQATHPGLDPKVAEAIKPLTEKLSALEQAEENRRAENEQRIAAEQQEKEDQALDSEIESTWKTNPTIDRHAMDETGEPLEKRILAHCAKIGTTSFRAGFRDYLHDQLLVQGQAQNRLQAVKGVQAKAKAGILGTTPAPVKELKTPNTKLPWNDEQFSSEFILKQLGMEA